MTIETEMAPTPGEMTPASESDWRSSLSEELRDHPVLSGFADVGELAREHVHVQKLIGRKGILPPGEGASDDDHARFYDALGRPPRHTDYALDDVERPEDLPWSAALEDSMLEQMHAAGLTNAQARALVSGYVDLQAQTWSAAQAEQARALEGAMTDLHNEWGSAFDAKLDMANRAFAMAFGEDVDEVRELRLADGSFLGDHPHLVRAFAAVGDLMSEAEFAGAGVMQGSPSRAQARAQLAELESDPAKRAALLDRSHPDHRQTVKQRSRLAGVAYGDAGEEVADLRL